MRGVRTRPWREFQNVHIIARIVTPCHSILAASLLIAYELFTNVTPKWHYKFVMKSRDTLEIKKK